MSLPELLVLSNRYELAPAEAASRLAAYGFSIPPVRLPPKSVADRVARLLSIDLDGDEPRLDTMKPVPYGHLVRASVELGLSMPEMAAQLADCGMRIAPAFLNEQKRIRRDIILLRCKDAGMTGWLPWQDPVPLLHLLRVSRKAGMTVREAAERLRLLGMDVPDVDETVAGLCGGCLG